jgi:5-methylcytosine-specific restriction protein A
MMRRLPMGNTGFPPKVRDLIRERADGLCEYCGVERGTEIHHRRPRAMGGTNQKSTNEASNGLLLCGGCHRWAESHRTDALLMGVLLLQIQNPLKSAVKYRGTYIYLDDAGNLVEKAA